MLELKHLQPSIPNTSSPVMRNNIHTRVIALLQISNRIVQEEIDQDGVDGRVWVQLLDLAPDQLDGVDAAAAELDLPG
jgi:hypothetical protein